MMNLKTWKMIFLIGAVLVISPLVAGAGPVPVEITGSTAEVTLLDGSATVVSPDMKPIRGLSQGDFLKQGEGVKVGAGSKIELRLPDGSYVRFDAGTVFELKALSMDRKKNERNINVNVVFGKIWATVSKFMGRKGRFEVSTKTSTAGVRGTKYRVNVNEDSSAVVKVYEGAVAVRGNETDEAGAAAPGAVSQPHRVAGPQPVAGPHPVSMERWVYVVKSMQQIVIRPDGTPTKPFRFSYKADRNDWVKWNEDRDARLEQQNEAPEADQPSDMTPGADVSPDAEAVDDGMSVSEPDTDMPAEEPAMAPE
ncbi:MAG: FecR domain-containing protein [Thermodesulfobacteriota bacterium]|nr:FecR domain-containing protein [Thermodesulfobacteriota bacterium]